MGDELVFKKWKGQIIMTTLVYIGILGTASAGGFNRFQKWHI